MLVKVFTVYDSKVEAFMSPFFFPTRGAAVRAWETTVNDPETMFSRHPADYTLFEIGVYDDQAGKFENYDAKQAIGTALEFVRKSPQQLPLLPKDHDGSAWPTISKAQ